MRAFYTNKTWNNQDSKETEQSQMAVLQEALKIATKVRVDELDMKKSALRHHTDLTVDEFLEAYASSDWKVWRFGVEETIGEDAEWYDIAEIFVRIDCTYKEKDSDENGEFYWLRRKDLFLWVEMNLDEGLALFEKNGLELVR